MAPLSKRFFLLQLVIRLWLSSSSEIVNKNSVSRRDQLLAWNISQEPSATQYNNNGIPVIRVPFLASDRDYAVNLYERDCKTEFHGISFQSFKEVPSSPENSMNVIVDLPMNPLELSTSAIWDDGQLSICVSLGLYNTTPDNPKSMLVSRKAVIYNIKLFSDLGGAKHSVGLITDNGYEKLALTDRYADGNDDTSHNNDLSIDLSGDVEAYLCDPENGYVKIEDPQPLQQFDILTLCAREVGSDDISINGFVTLTLVQDIEGGGKIKFVAVQNGEVPLADKDLVVTDCLEDTPICYASIVPVENFFDMGAVKPIAIYGEVSLSFGSESGADKLFDVFQLDIDLHKPEKCEDGNIFDSVVETFYSMVATLSNSFP